MAILCKSFDFLLEGVTRTNDNPIFRILASGLPEVFAFFEMRREFLEISRDVEISQLHILRYFQARTVEQLMPIIRLK